MSDPIRPVDSDLFVVEPPTHALSRRVASVVLVLLDYGQNGAVHHLTWVVDQALREACGSPSAYRAIVRAWESEHPGCRWATGIAP